MDPGMIQKHQYLPTNTLLLVSKSGFTKTALDAVAKEGGRVRALKPEFIEVGGQPVLKSLWADKLLVKPNFYELKVLRSDGTVLTATFTPDHFIFDASGVVIGTLGDLASAALQIQWLSEYLLQRAHHSTKKLEIKGFNVGIPVVQLEYFLRDESTGELHHVLHLHIGGEANFDQSEVTLTLAALGERPYAFAETVVFDKEVVVVATEGAETNELKFSMRTKDGSPIVSRDSLSVDATPFSGLLELPIPGKDEIQYVGDV